MVFDPNPSCCNKLYVTRSCIDTHIASTPMYSSIAFCLTRYCGYEPVDTCSKAHMVSPPQLMRVFQELQALFVFICVLIPKITIRAGSTTTQSIRL